MPYTLDPEIYEAMKPMLEKMKDAPKIPVGDILARRANIEFIITQMFSSIPFPSDVETKDFHAPAADGYEILLRWYCKRDAPATSGPALLVIHGGGMTMLSVDIYNPIVANQVSLTGVPVLAVDYRLAPEHPHPTLVEDCYTGLTFLRDHAKELSIDPTRIAIMGDSAGGGIAAAVALMARDRNFSPPLAKQILIYPMLDDRNSVPDPHIAPYAFFTYDDNITCWGALLGDAAGGPDVHEYAAPARAKDLSRLPATYIEVGQLDIFLYEDMEYAKRISQTGTNVEFYLHPGAPHGFEGMAPSSGVGQRAIQNRYRAIRSF